MQHPTHVYDHWEKNTAHLCEIGTKANQFIEQKYFHSDYLDFFSEKSLAVHHFKALVSYRHQYWLNHPLRNQKIEQWLRELDYFITLTFQAHNSLGLLKEFVWAKLSTLPLLITIVAELKKDYTPDIKRIITAIEMIEHFFKEKDIPVNHIQLIEHARLPPEIVKQLNKQRFLNVYQIQHPHIKKRIFAEVIETWNFHSNRETIDLIQMNLPLSIGCIAHCKMCEFSQFKPINIPSATLKQLIHSQLRNNYGIPFTEKPHYHFYYLGGGDALQYKALFDLLSYVSETFQQPQQIISTIAFGSTQKFRTLLEKISTIPHLGLQWSLNTFNEEYRRFITGCHSLIPIPICIKLLEDYAYASQRKVTVSLMLFHHLGENIHELKHNILSHLDPKRFKLNFANIQPNQLSFSKQKSHSDFNQALVHWAVKHGYESTLDSPPEQEQQLAFCGKISRTTYNGNQPYRKIYAP